MDQPINALLAIDKHTVPQMDLDSGAGLGGLNQVYGGTKKAKEMLRQEGHVIVSAVNSTLLIGLCLTTMYGRVLR